MATKFESDCPSPRGDESDGEEDNSLEPEYQEEEEEQEQQEHPKSSNNNVTNILRKLQSSGALIRKPKQEYYCFTCRKDYINWEELEKHLIQHVSLPSLILEKLPSDDEDTAPSEDENWSDEDEASPPQPSPQKTPQKIDISQILNKTGLSIIKPSENKPSTSDEALSKLSGLGFIIKKNTTPIKQEKSDPDQANTNDVMKKLGQLGGIKLKLKSQGGSTNTFKVVNGLKDFKASDEEDEGSGNEENQDYPEGDFDDDEGKLGEQDDSIEEPNVSCKKSESPISDNPLLKKVLISPHKNIQIKGMTPKIEPLKIVKQTTQQVLVGQVQPAKTSGRPTIKQTPKRGANMSIPPRISQLPQADVVTTSTSEQRTSQDVNIDNVVVKQEVDNGVGSQPSNEPLLFSGQIKAERTTPPATDSIPAIAVIKSEPNLIPTTFGSGPPPLTSQIANATPLNPVTKIETPEMTIIEINGDSNDEDDDCCVVSATPAPDLKPVIPKIENTQPYPLPPPCSSQSSYSTSSLSSRMPTTPSTEKQHSFNWNAPDSKPAVNLLMDKSADEIFESLLSSSTKKEHSSLSEASEYISLDTLGPQQSCEVCNIRFTDMSLLEEHRRTTGHSSSLVPPIAPSSSTLLPYTPSSNILSSLIPVKQFADQVGKFSGGGNSSQFTHQQNVMINIQAYPGASGVMMPSQPYNSYPSGQNVPPGYSQAGMNNMYGAANQMPGQYPGQNFMGHQGYGQQFQPTMPQNTFSTPTSQYPSASPLQSMQQAVYGQTHSPMGQMRPPDSSPSQPFPASSPGGSMKPPTSTGSGIKIQNVQTFPPGQLIGSAGQPVTSGPQGTSVQMAPPGQMPSSQIRMASGANVSGTRPRMPTVRGTRPSIRPGIQVHGQVRGSRPNAPRMPIKRPGGMPGGPTMKRRPDVMLPGRHDNEDCHVMSMQKQRDGLPMIQSVQGAKDKLNLGSQISITKKTFNKEANAMANVLASRGISVKQKQKSRTPSPERPVPHIPNLGAGVSIKHTSKASNFSIPEAKVGSGMYSCKICKKMFMNQNSLSVHMFNAHPQSKVPMFKCDECPASYPKSLQLQHHKRVFHNVTGANRELGLPVVDLSQEENLKQLSSLGIYSFIPLANREQANGCFGIPVVSVHNGFTSGLQALSADGILSLGPLKPLPNS